MRFYLITLFFYLSCLAFNTSKAENRHPANISENYPSGEDSFKDIIPNLVEFDKRRIWLGIEGGVIQDNNARSSARNVSSSYGPHIQGELQYHVIDSLSFIHYNGVNYTQSLPSYDSREIATKIWLTGFKINVVLPVSFFGIFLSAGIGASIGQITSKIDKDLSVSGISYHVPLGLGTAIGERKNLIASIGILYHPSQKIFTGGLTFSHSFALNL